MVSDGFANDSITVGRCELEGTLCSIIISQVVLSSLDLPSKRGY